MAAAGASTALRTRLKEFGQLLIFSPRSHTGVNAGGASYVRHDVSVDTATGSSSVFHDVITSSSRGVSVFPPQSKRERDVACGDSSRAVGGTTTWHMLSGGGDNLSDEEVFCRLLIDPFVRAFGLGSSAITTNGTTQPSFKADCLPSFHLIPIA